jgi:hypothetical protein
MSDGSERDEALLARLQKVFDLVDPVPPSVVEAARAAYSWRRIDAELAELLGDSATDPEHWPGHGDPATALAWSASVPAQS